MIRYFPILLLLAQPLPAGTQTADPSQALPDPATVTVPDVSPSQDPKVRSEGYRLVPIPGLLGYEHGRAVDLRTGKLGQ